MVRIELSDHEAVAIYRALEHYHERGDQIYSERWQDRLSFRARTVKLSYLLGRIGGDCMLAIERQEWRNMTEGG